jgi:hypothetical protein
MKNIVLEAVQQSIYLNTDQAEKPVDEFLIFIILLLGIRFHPISGAVQIFFGLRSAF